MRAFIVLLLVGLCLATPVRFDWTEAGRAHPDEVITVRFALAQKNLDTLASALLDAADIYSANYGKWWSAERIADLVAPAKEDVQYIIHFLEAKGIKNIVNHRDSLKVTAPVSIFEDLFQINLLNFVHPPSGTVIVRAENEYLIPTEIADLVDFVAGLYEFPQMRRGHQSALDGATDGYVVPYTIGNLYQIPAQFPVNKNSSLALAEFLNYGSYLTQDLFNFSKANGINISVSHIVGNFSSSGLESTLDVEYGAAIAQNTTIWYWTQSGWMYDMAVDVGATPNPPLVVSMSWGWPEPNQCGKVANCTKGETSRQYVERVNVEFNKLGLMGITMVAASGDQGAPGDNDADCEHTQDNVLTGIFPGASPWVLSVGATMLTNMTTPEEEASASWPSPPLCKDFNCSTSTTEVVCTFPYALITSGGGFSAYAPMPSFQSAAVKSYLSSGVQLPPSQYYNVTNRAFPDVAALGHNYLVMVEYEWEMVDGTSCATPVWAAIISLLNSNRMNHGKPPLGFVTPLIYQAYAADPTIFTDITSGNNKCTEFCCDKYGYEASKGWDPVTGVGSPVFPKLLAFIESLSQ